MKYEESIRVDSHDVDYRGWLRPSAFLRIFQEAAYREHEVYGPTIRELREKQLAFILSRVRVSMPGSVSAGEKLTVSTWITEVRGFSFCRYGVITKEDGSEAAEMASQWATVDTGSGQLIRSDSLSLGFGTDEPLPCGAPPRLRPVLDPEKDAAGDFTVRYADADENRHMNNTRYPDVFCGFLPIEGKRVTEMAFCFQKEAPLGSSFTVLSAAQPDGSFGIRTVLPDGSTGTEAVFRLEPLA